MKMEAYDWKAKLLKSFEVVSGQKIECRWFLKEMRIEEFARDREGEYADYLDIKKMILRNDWRFF
jgi:hypothetical protein